MNLFEIYFSHSSFNQQSLSLLECDTFILLYVHCCIQLFQCHNFCLHTLSLIEIVVFFTDNLCSISITT